MTNGSEVEAGKRELSLYIGCSTVPLSNCCYNWLQVLDQAIQDEQAQTCVLVPITP
jgi:hypothetical protein